MKYDKETDEEGKKRGVRKKQSGHERKTKFRGPKQS